jgi:photosystem II stability/assembly factor-like uncharacterized protein
MRASILKTTDMGKPFSLVNFPDGSDTKPVPDFISEDEGYAINANNELVHTLDGGNYWKKIWP